MSAHLIYDNAPLGSLIRYFDGTQKPPARFMKKLAAWQSHNGVGRLVKREPPRTYASFVSPGSFTLHEGDFGGGGVIAVTIMRSHSLTSTLFFEIAELPAIGSVRILNDFFGGNSELLHLAAGRPAAEAWLAKNRYSNARFEEVTADERAADAVEGRAA